MRFFPSEPDIATVFNRIKDGDIDLQPDFQRNEVWPVKKQQRLIDTILRGWVIPPILLVADGSRLQVLDGQQRLAAIRDFKLNRFSIDGEIAPANSAIQALDGVRCSALPPEISKAFDRTSLRMYEIADFAPEEPAEIFFRLNQPTALTSAERRNAFFGPVRHQIRELVDLFESGETTARLLGFSNARMAYDDVIARFAFTLEEGTLRKKVTEAGVNQMYRRPNPLSDETCVRIDTSLRALLAAIQTAHSTSASIDAGVSKLNKAAFYSWLLFLARLESMDIELVVKFFAHFESVRGAFHNFDDGMYAIGSRPRSFPLMLLFSDRATARVSDVSSVLLRDLALWASWEEFTGGSGPRGLEIAVGDVPTFLQSVPVERPEQYEREALSFIEVVNWGEKV